MSTEDTPAPAATNPDLTYVPTDTPIGRAVAELVAALRIDTSVPGLDVALQPYATLLAAMVRVQSPQTQAQAEPQGPPSSVAPVRNPIMAKRSM